MGRKQQLTSRFGGTLPQTDSQTKIARGFHDFFEYDSYDIDMIQCQSTALIRGETPQFSIVPYTLFVQRP